MIESCHVYEVVMPHTRAGSRDTVGRGDLFEVFMCVT